MPNFIFAYHGGKRPDTPEAIEAEMQQWNNWYASMGDRLVDGGGPVGTSRTVTSSGVENNGGSNPLSGFTIIRADSQDDAVELAKGCPIVSNGTVEVVEILEM